jgi:hypothetical protein
LNHSDTRRDKPVTSAVIGTCTVDSIAIVAAGPQSVARRRQAQEEVNFHSTLETLAGFRRMRSMTQRKVRANPGVREYLLANQLLARESSRSAASTGRPVDEECACGNFLWPR